MLDASSAEEVLSRSSQSPAFCGSPKSKHLSLRDRTNIKIAVGFVRSFEAEVERFARKAGGGGSAKSKRFYIRIRLPVYVCSSCVLC